MAGHRHPVEIPDQYYRAIGQVVAGWNLTEALVASIIWKIHKIRDVRKGRTLIYCLPLGVKLKILAQSFKHFSKSNRMKEELRMLLGRINELKDERNLLAHGLWGRMPNEKVWKVFKMQDMDDDLLLIRKKVSEDDLVPEKTADAILALNKDLKRFMNRYRIPMP